MINEIKYNKWSYFAYFFINFLFMCFIFCIIYFIINQLSPYYNLANSLNENYLYCYNAEEIDDLMNENQKLEAAYYKFDYILNEDGSYSAIVYMNENAKELGIPSVDYNLFFISSDLTYLPKDVLITTKQKNETETIEYYDINLACKIENIFMNYSYELEYLSISNKYIEENGFDLAVYKSFDSNISKMSEFNQNLENRYFMTGEQIKKQYNEGYGVTAKIFIILSLIPIVFACLSLANIINYFLKREKDYIIINRILYKKKRKTIFEYVCKLIALTFVSSILALFVAMMISSLYDIEIFLTSLLSIMLVEGIFIFVLVYNFIKKIYSYKSWGDLDD